MKFNTSLWSGALALLAIAAGTPADASEKYSWNDVKALLDQENWSEALDHFLDIAPTQRNAEWRSGLERAAKAHLSSSMTPGSGYEPMAIAEGLISRYPDLKKSKEFMKLRTDAGLKTFEQCFSNRYAGPQCAQELIKFVESDPTNDELAFKAGQMTRLNAGYGQAAHLFEIAFRSKERRKDCGDRQVAIAIPMTLGNVLDEPLLKKAQRIAFDDCWDALKGELLKKFHDGQKRYLVSTCAGLTKKKALTEFQKALCTDTLASKD